MKLHQSIPLHLWIRGKWGGDAKYPPNLDCRVCRFCGRFEIWAYWDWNRADRANFPDAVFA